jgi:retron-type reverse transcriptase
MDAPGTVPAWLLRPLPANAQTDEALLAKIDKHIAKLPGSIGALRDVLDLVRMYREYDTAANRAAVAVWEARDLFFHSASIYERLGLLAFAAEHLVEQAQARILRRLMKDPAGRVRTKAQRLVERLNIREVALPLDAEGDWSPAGWSRGTTGAPLVRHPQGRRVQERHGVPEIGDLSQLRALLGIVSERQLGYFLLASDKDDGPYRRFTLPKRGGGTREICAPKKQLRWVQRQLLDKVLAPVAVHDAAHGFIPGRSTVTNAAPHLGAELLLKFDLTDFFPTIHFYRVVGLFTRLGYPVGNARFSSRDESPQVAPTLARLCCYTPGPRSWGNAVLPQGAPTSPAISNLVCRRLDARLTGLAKRNAGVYTRYADDLTFSFKSADVELGRFRWWVDQICHQEGFFVNQSKFHVIRGSQRQVVTGLVVNDTLHVPRDQRRRFRAILNNCRRHGVAAQARGNPRFADYLRGYASYIHMVQPEEGAELLQQVEELLGPEAEAEEAP